MSTLSSKKWDKYKYSTGKDLGYKPVVVEQAKFEYFPLDNVFSKELKKIKKGKEFWKRVKIIEDKNKEQLDKIK